MGSILHANAKTTPRIRKEIQNASASIAVLAKHYNLNPKTISRWKHADGITDKKSGPKIRKSVLSAIEQQTICEVRRQLQLPLDDIFIVLKPGIPKLTRSNLHRCLQYHGLSRLPKEQTSSSNANKKNRLSLTLLVIYMLTSPNCALTKESSICLLPLIE